MAHSSPPVRSSASRPIHDRVERALAPDAPMRAVPSRDRERILSGMRWTLWLSLLAAPFGYATTVLLARVSPEALGSYGLLMVYIGLVASLLYLGGDAVTIRFVPQMPVEARLSFLASYFLVSCASLVPWLAAATIRPAWLCYLLGRQTGGSLQLFVLYMAPLYIGCMIAIAGLKAVLDIRRAQLLSRLMTFGTFFAYAGLYFCCQPFLKTYYSRLMWGIYLSLTGLTLILAVGRLTRLPDFRSSRWRMNFFLPLGFWRYTLALQQVSVLNFLLQRLDLVLVLNSGSLQLLGRYVAILTVAGLVQLAGRCFLDPLLPALTNLFARQDYTAASETLSLHLRILFIVSCGASTCLLFLVLPITRLLGAQYVTDQTPFIFMIVLAGMATPGAAGNILLTACAKPHRCIWVGLGQLALLILLFAALWPKYYLMGAVLASGISGAVSNVVQLTIAKHVAPVRFHFYRDYLWLIIATSTAAIASLRLHALGLLGSLLAFAACVLIFLLPARYTLAELRALATCLIPALAASDILDPQP